MDPCIGKKLDGRYEILERIGAGGMANVYRARDDRLNRLVAVKVLRSDLAQNEDFRRRFHAESQAVAQLSSPHIVSIYDVSRSGEIEYIVMELIDGITLKQYMEKRGQLNWRESLHFMIQIMRGLANAHSRGIVHRDIKPQNIMVLRDGSVKVADFGIAVLENSTQTLTRQALGSVHYISPEQARGERTDARSDIYSAGVVLYEMLTGQLPFEGESAVAVAIQHLSSTPPEPRSIHPEIPEQLELICLKAMAPDMKRRYASAEEMIRDLETFRRDPAIPLDFQITDIRPPVSDEPTRTMKKVSSGRSALSSDHTIVHTTGGHTPVRGIGGNGFTRGTGGKIPVHTAETERLQPQKILISFAALIAMLCVAVVLFRSIMSSFSAVTRDPFQDAYVVQSVLGYTVDRARELDGVKGIFEIVEEGEQPSDDYPQGTIMRQDPAANNYRKGNNLIIRVWVSSGEDTAEMPNVINQTPTVAEKVTLRLLIQQYGLTVEIREEDMQYSDTIPAGSIIASVPGEGGTLHKGDTVRLIVSRGKYTWLLPRFVGMNLNQVSSQLDSLKLGHGEITFEYNEQPFGTILRQIPEERTPVTDGTKVHFVVSQGPEPPPPEQTVTVSIPLPEDRELAYMEIWRDGTRIEAGRVDCTSGSYEVKVTGNGETELTVYLDNEEWARGSIDLDGSGEAVVLSVTAQEPEIIPAEDEFSGTGDILGNEESSDGETSMETSGGTGSVPDAAALPEDVPASDSVSDVTDTAALPNEDNERIHDGTGISDSAVWESDVTDTDTADTQINTDTVDTQET